MDVRRMDSGHAIDYRTSDIDTLFQMDGKEGRFSVSFEFFYHRSRAQLLTINKNYR